MCAHNGCLFKQRSRELRGLHSQMRHWRRSGNSALAMSGIASETRSAQRWRCVDARKLIERAGDLALKAGKRRMLPATPCASSRLSG
jgi:hypothetical protein